MKVKKKKQTPSEVLAAIIDKDLLNKRKEKINKQENKVKIEDNINETNKKLKWYEKPIFKEDFITKEYNGKFYTKHKEWANNVWIGAYDNIEIVNEIILSYVKNSKKSILKRKLDDRIHSILIDIK